MIPDCFFGMDLTAKGIEGSCFGANCMRVSVPVPSSLYVGYLGHEARISSRGMQGKKSGPSTTHTDFGSQLFIYAVVVQGFAIFAAYLRFCIILLFLEFLGCYVPGTSHCWLYSS